MPNYEYQQSINSTPYYTSNNSNISMSDGAAVWCLFAVILAIIGGILTYFLFVKNSTEPKGKFAKWLKKFLDFKIMWIEPILKVVYYIATIFIILVSFAFLSSGIGGVILWLLTLVLGPILIRLAYESFMMFIMVWRNTKDISDNIKKK